MDGLEVRFKIDPTFTVAGSVAYNKEFVLLNDMTERSKYTKGTGFIGKFLQKIFDNPHKNF